MGYDVCVPKEQSSHSLTRENYQWFNSVGGIYNQPATTDVHTDSGLWTGFGLTPLSIRRREYRIAVPTELYLRASICRIV